MAKEKEKKLYSKKGKLKRKYYEKELERLQEELVKLQHWIKDQGLKVCVVFEGRDAAGKGGVIKRIIRRLNPRIVRVVALGTPTEKEKEQWYFQRYADHLPTAGEMVLFDRSWYNRAGVERVMGFCTDDEYREFMRVCEPARNLSECWFVPVSSSSNTGSRLATRNRSVVFKDVITIRCAVGSLAPWIWRRGLNGWNTPGPRMLCLCTPISKRHHGTWSMRISNAMPALTASATC